MSTAVHGLRSVVGPCCAKNGSNAGKTDRSLIALGNPACPNKFARRREGGGASFLVVCGDLKPPAHLVHEKERKRRRYDRATLAVGASRGRPGHPAWRPSSGASDAGPPAAHRSVPDRCWPHTTADSAPRYRRQKEIDKVASGSYQNTCAQSV